MLQVAIFHVAHKIVQISTSTYNLHIVHHLAYLLSVIKEELLP